MALSPRFKSSALPVTLPYPAIKNLIASGDKDSYQQDNDYTDVLFRIMGISRLHHPLAVTIRYLADPEQTFSLGASHDLEDPMKFYGSAGLFYTAYKTLPGFKNGLALILRDQIRDVSRCQPDKNVVIGLKGLKTDDDTFLVTGIACGRIDKDGQVIGLEYRHPNQKDADTALSLAEILMRQMREQKKLDLTRAVAELADSRQPDSNIPAPSATSGPRSP